MSDDVEDGEEGRAKPEPRPLRAFLRYFLTCNATARRSQPAEWTH